MTNQPPQEGYLAESVLVGLVANTVARLRGWLAATWFGRVAATSERSTNDATDTSVVVTGLRRLAHSVRHSHLYRWLTKEPEPDAIVIDLRDTYTVAPFIALLDRLTPVVERTWRGSLAYRTTERLGTSVKREWIAESRTIQLLRDALEPPAPPEEHRE
ncbi:hypothetical protein [Halorussus salinisoli]|uniref:hypothetical protein n=1 Tax=Halorussus salinisoli TaxID=2558242 RepID=UPI0010C1B897|nr:hypothetical protein [Halorussus salinisoli]